MNKIILLLDCGNTALKCQFNQKISTFYLSDELFISQLSIYIHQINPDTKVALSSVASAQTQATIQAVLNQHFSQPINVAISEPQFKTLKIGYLETAQLGVDRWLAMIATQHIKTNRIIIDAGSWIKMDIVLADGQHQGGVIISKTEKDEETLFKRFALDKNHCGHSPTLFGQSTQQCLCLCLKHYGLAAVKTFLTQWLKALNQPCQIIITGGDADRVKNTIQQLSEKTQKYILDIQQNKNLVLSGLSIRYASYN